METVGEVVVRGDNVMDGYYREPEKTAEVLTADGFYRSGDLGEISADGSLRIIGRMRDWVAQQYPGTLISISSYGWGAYNHITGALAEADVLGIFAREGVSLATLEAPARARLAAQATGLSRPADSSYPGQHPRRPTASEASPW